MNAGVYRRVGLAALSAASALALGTAPLVLSPDAARSGPPGDQLRPDLVVERPHQLYLRGSKQRLRLRLSNTISNKGSGPLEVTGGGAGDDCNRPDQPDGRHTLQNVYSDDLSNPRSLGFFKRSQDESFTQLEAGCSRYHSAHDHWHFDNFARFTLVSERTGEVAGTARKVSFCLIDTGQPHPQLPGSPRRSYYPQDPEEPRFPTCSATSVDGLSIGWEDTYDAGLAGQAIDITGIRRGSYCLVVEADPADESNPGGVLLESDESNNARDQRLRIRPHRRVLRRLGPTCRLPGG